MKAVTKRLRRGASQKLWDEATRIIAGGTGLLSKRPERSLPEYWPAYFTRAKGIKITDLDGKTYLDFTTMSLGACVLGYADRDINGAVKKVINSGSIATLNSPEDVELARLLLKDNQWAGMVRFTRGGGDAMAVAARVARAASGKDTLAFCGYHGWHDWYLSSNLASDKNLDGHLLPGLIPKGVPRSLRGTAFPFRYNHIEELENIVKKRAVGAIVMEPIRNDPPRNGFLKGVRAIANRIGAVLVFDEVTSGFRTSVGGVYKSLRVTPDIVVFAKAISNGYPMGAVIGRKEVMKAAQESFISSTYWTERTGPAAALATIRKMKRERVPAHLMRIGRMIGKGWERLAKKHGLSITVHGPWPLVGFAFTKGNHQELVTLFTQEMLRRGFLAGRSVYVSFAHKASHVHSYLRAVDEVFGIIAQALVKGNVRVLLLGRPASSGFYRLT